MFREGDRYRLRDRLRHLPDEVQARVLKGGKALLLLRDDAEDARIAHRTQPLVRTRAGQQRLRAVLDEPDILPHSDGGIDGYDGRQGVRTREKSADVGDLMRRYGRGEGAVEKDRQVSLFEHRADHRPETVSCDTIAPDA